MVEELFNPNNFGISQQSVQGFGSTLATWSIILVVLLIIGLLIWFMFWWFSHKVVFIIRKVAGDRTITVMDRARVIMKKGQPVKWKLRKLGLNVPVPPKDALDVTNKGKEFVEAYFTEDGEVHYIVDRFDKSESKLGSLHPVKNVDKEFYVQQVEEAAKYKKKNLGDIILQLAPYMILVIILVVFLVFFEKAVAPSQAFAEQLVVASKEVTRAIELIQTCSQTVGVQNVAPIPIPN